MKLAYETFGSGPPLVMLHGLFGSGACWHREAKALAASHRVLTIDLVNHGDSPESDTMSYDAMARDVFDVIRRESAGPVSLVGHCIGGKVAMALALLVPEAVDRLCVIDTAPITFLDDWMRQLRTMRRSLAVNGGATVLAARRAAACGHLLSRFMLPLAAIDTCYVDWRCNLDRLEWQLPALREFPQECIALRSQLQLHAVLGELSSAVRPADASVYAPMFGRARVHVITGANHWVHASRPEALLACLRRLTDRQRMDAMA